MSVANRQTIRMRLHYERPWREHERCYVDLFGDPAVAAALWPGAWGARTAAQAVEMLSADIERWREDGFGPWVFYERTSGVFVGRGGLRRATVAGEGCVEVLYAVRSDAWGRGYASEIAMVAVAHARELRLENVVGLTASTNAASRRVLEKAGMRFDRDLFEHAGLPHLLGRLLPNS